MFTRNDMVNRAIRERLNQSLAPRTNKAYQSAFNSYETACAALNLQPWPAEEGKLIAYAAFAHDCWGLRPNTIDSYISALAHKHRLAGWEHPRAGDGLLKLVLDGSRRINRDHGVAPRPRQGISGTLLKQIIGRLDLTDFRAARFAAYASMSYFGAFRANELISTLSGERCHVEDLALVTDGTGLPLYLTVRQFVSKTRQFGPTISVPLPFTGGVTCPVTLFYGYGAMLPASRLASAPVLTDMDGLTPYTYAQALEDTRFYCAGLGIPVEELGTHSFRIGLATEAGRLNLPDRVIKTLGRWESDAFLVYVRTDPRELAHHAALLAG